MDTTNLVTDGVFAAACGVNWTCGVGWNILGGQAIKVFTGNFDFMYQDNVFIEGHEYTVKFDAIFIAPNPYQILACYIGYYTIDELIINSDNLGFGTHSIQIDNVISLSSSSRIVFGGQTLGTRIDNVEAYEWFWNDPIEVEPGGWDESKYILKESQINESLITSFISQLTFIQDGYDYLIGVYESEGMGARVPIKIEYYDQSSDTWEDLIEGKIVIGNMNIDDKTKSILADIEGTELEPVIQQDWNSRNIIYGLGASKTIDNTPAFVPATDFVELHDPTTGLAVASRYVGHQYRMLNELIIQASRMRMRLESTYLASALYDDAGTDIWLGATRGKEIRAGSENEIAIISLQDYFSNYGFVTNLVFRYDVSVNNVPLLVVEDKASVINTVPTIDYDNAFLEPYTFALDREYKNIETGFLTLDGIYEDFQFISEGKGLETDFNIKCGWMRHYLVIYDLLVATNIQYDQNMIFIEYYDDAGTWKSRPYVTAAVNWDYNQNILGDLYIDQWTQFLGTVYKNSINIADKSTPMSDPIWRYFEFNISVTLRDLFNIRDNPFTYVGFNGYDTDSQGLVKRLEYPLKNAANGDAIARIKILAE